MDMHSLIHPSAESMRAPAAAAAAFPSAVAATTPAALPGLRAHFPTLPLRLPAFRPSPSDHSVPALSAPQDLRRLSPSSSSSSSAAAPQPASTPTLAPLRFIIPSSHRSSNSSMSHTYSGSAGSETGGFGSMTATTAEPEPELEPSRTYAQVDVAAATEAAQTHQEAGEATIERDRATSADAAAKGKKPAPKRVRPVKNSNRSTKSKARPGLRKGKWTDEESRYATQLTYYFKEGLLPIDRGTMLRLYLSQKLNCEPMRITKKFTGVECIGKQVFRPCHSTPESRMRLMQAQLELVALEAAFIKKLKENREDVPSSADDNDSGSAAESSSASRQPDSRSRSSMGHSTDDDEGFTSDSSSSSSPSFARIGSMLKKPSAPTKKSSEEDADSANAVGLLLDFFHKANRNEKSGGAIAANCAATETQAAAGASSFESDSVASSPTKRIRALSISNYVHDDSLTKRSRVDSSFPAVCAK